MALRNKVATKCGTALGVRSAAGAFVRERAEVVEVHCEAFRQVAGRSSP
jgi:hypothetical protein